MPLTSSLKYQISYKVDYVHVMKESKLTDTIVQTTEKRVVKRVTK